MKKIIASITMMILSAAFFSSCTESANNKLILGHWRAVSWNENGVANAAKAEGTEFNFDEKLRYTFSHNGDVKKGSYKVENNLLFTTEDGMQEIMVNISKLNKDSMVFDMNNAGTAEQMTLKRTK